jgi:small-conductance mechanosensitive channel
MKKLTDWWQRKDKMGKINFLIALVFWLLALVLVVLVSVSGILFPNNTNLKQALVLNRAFLATWDDTWPRLLGMVYYFCLLMGVSMVVRFLLAHIFVTSKKAATVIKLVNSFIKYAMAIVLIFVWIGIWGVDTGALLVSAGIVALIIGLGAQSLISDIIAGLNIVFEDEYKVGDIVVVDDFRGTIQEIGLTTTKIMDPAGNVKIINNSQISTVVNLSDHPSVAACLMYIDYDEDLVKDRETDRRQRRRDQEAASFRSRCPEVHRRLSPSGWLHRTQDDLPLQRREPLPDGAGYEPGVLPPLPQ